MLVVNQSAGSTPGAIRCKGSDTSVLIQGVILNITVFLLKLSKLRDMACIQSSGQVICKIEPSVPSVVSNFVINVKHPWIVLHLYLFIHFYSPSAVVKTLRSLVNLLDIWKLSNTPEDEFQFLWDEQHERLYELNIFTVNLFAYNQTSKFRDTKTLPSLRTDNVRIPPFCSTSESLWALQSPAVLRRLGQGYNLPFSFCCDNNFFHQSRHQRMEAPPAPRLPLRARGLSQRTWHIVTWCHIVTPGADIQIQTQSVGFYSGKNWEDTEFIDCLTQSGSKPPQR